MSEREEINEQSWNSRTTGPKARKRRADEFQVRRSFRQKCSKMWKVVVVRSVSNDYRQIGRVKQGSVTTERRDLFALISAKYAEATSTHSSKTTTIPIATTNQMRDAMHANSE